MSFYDELSKIDVDKFVSLVDSRTDADVERAIYKTTPRTVEDFAALIKSKKEDSEEYEYSLRYNEFIPVAFKSLQYCLQKIREQQEEINKLKNM